MLYADPQTYGYTDIAEDLPGKARAVAPVFKNVLPSAAIISRDPEKRKQQIEEAAASIRQTQQSKGGILPEAWHNIKHMVPDAAMAGAVLGGAIPLLGMRRPWKANAAGKLTARSPIDLVSNIKKLLSDGAYRKELAGHIGEGGLFSATHAAGTGALLPMVSRNVDISDESMDDAKKIMQEQPQLTSLPASEMISAMHGTNAPTDRLRHGLLGAGIGAAGAIPGSAIPAGIATLGLLAKNILARSAGKVPSVGLKGVDSFFKNRASSAPINTGLKNLFLEQYKGNLPTALKWGTGIGALSGALTQPLADDQQ
jgi:hypothetical protein